MNKDILNKLRNDAGFGYGIAMGLYTHNASEMWVEYDKDGEECWPSREIMEKFAKLIVKECAKVADIADENKCEWIGGNILTHFGVEE